MWFAKTSSGGFRGWFLVTQNNGNLRTGLLSGDFTVTVANPADSASTAPAVTESSQLSGLYIFDIPTSFLTTHGIGVYGVSVQVDTFAGPSGGPNVRAAFSEPLRITVRDFDDLAQPGDAMDLISNAVDAASLAGDIDTYQAKIWLFDDEDNLTDRYAVAWFKNGQPVLAGITSPTVQVIDLASGSDLVASTAMTAIGAYFKYDETTNRIVSGQAYIAQAQATIDSSVRTWVQPIGRDSQ